MDRVDIAVCGGSFAGVALAVALASAHGGQQLTIALIDARDLSQLKDPAEDGRASAIIPASVAMLEALELWPKLQPKAQAVHKMMISDSELDDPVRPDFLQFSHEDLHDEQSALAYIVRNRDLLDALYQRLHEFDNIRVCSGEPITELGALSHLDPAQIRLAGGEHIQADLVVAADGSNSFIRQQAGIKTIGWNYQQNGIVAEIELSRDHQATAVQHFLPAGPFALLPLPGNKASIVWSETPSVAQHMMALTEAEFIAEIGVRLGTRFGTVIAAHARQAFPLQLQLARRFVASRLALVGDAAHQLHPLAGQGINHAFKDIAALAEVIIDARRLGLDIGSLGVLGRYERWRRFDAVGSAFAFDVLNRMFSNNSSALRFMRDIGLGAVNRWDGFRRVLAKEAAGTTGKLPSLLRGQSL